MLQPLPLLTIAASDSGGAAGAQADLKTWAALGVYGLCALTAVTAQNSVLVQQVHFLPPEMIAAQIDAVLSDYGAAAIKTGFLGRVEIIEVVADRLAYWCRGGSETRPYIDDPGTGGSETRPYSADLGTGGSQTRPYIVIDPVLVNHRGEAMFGPDVADAYRRWLFPLADLVTPNAAEARLLGLGEEAQGRGGAGEQGGQSVAARVLVKGARRTAGAIVDVYWDGARRVELPQALIDTANTHGSGDTLSAAICAFRAAGHDWPEAVRRAQAFTHAAIQRGADWRLGAGHGPLGHTPYALDESA